MMAEVLAVLNPQPGQVVVHPRTDRVRKIVVDAGLSAYEPGITAELDLQLYTRRLHEGRADFGAETHWNRILGRA